MTERELRALPNIGPAIAKTLMRLGIERPDDLRGQTADQLYRRLCDLDGRRHDPCLLDTFVAAVDHADGAPTRPWSYYSRIRKRAQLTSALPVGDTAQESNPRPRESSVRSSRLRRPAA